MVVVPGGLMTANREPIAAALGQTSTPKGVSERNQGQ
jgi:hypothetical protein